MAIFDLDKAISIEFDADETVQKKILGVWNQPRFRDWNIGMVLICEEVVVSVMDREVTRMPFALFDSLSGIEIGDIILKETRKKYGK